ncbi:polyketide cyclase [Pedobacter yulinensis]|uniref:Polyketide cyclase n=1 Tax=Pedobacter yulinensis TaxID=2126353 RepID=A0A2T3HPH9_9SPHI|nr:SRPBCC family protein [Pedobacter yulinensis]PST84336.1 polyketide cyclase [Pedobacter yulinensis]
MITDTQKTVETALLIRKPARDVYEALIDPDQTSKFWFSHGSGRLDEHQTVTWNWDMYGVSTGVKVLALVPEEKISFAWGNEGMETTVEWTLTPIDGKGTFLQITEHGINGTDDEVLGKIKDSTGGFVLVLAGLKAWLEHGIRLNLVGDRFPPEIAGQKH